jgi:hypothetical protein
MMSVLEMKSLHPRVIQALGGICWNLEPMMPSLRFEVLLQDFCRIEEEEEVLLSSSSLVYHKILKALVVVVVVVFLLSFSQQQPMLRDGVEIDLTRLGLFAVGYGSLHCIVLLTECALVVD